jgi:multiphosphoryl transfer protein
MIGFVVVSHSARLAEGVCELAAQVGQGRVALAAAGGTDDPENPLGTDAFRVQRAIESVWSEDGVLVFTDLGSAVLSAEMALEFLDGERRSRVRLCDAPLVEGVVAAVSQAAAGAGMEEIVREAEQAAAGKAAPAEIAAPLEEAEVALANRLGLHARPAARLVRLARRFRARVSLENLTRPAGPADAGGINGVLALGARQGHRVRIRAAGEEARPALAAVRDFLASGCGEQDRPPQPAEAPAPPAAAAQGPLAGLPASPGIAIGPLARLRPALVAIVVHTVDDPEAECRRLEDAIRCAMEETGALATWAAANAGADEAGIFDAQSLLLDDPEFAGAALRTVRERRVNAEAAWQEAGERLAARLRTLDDPYLAARAADVADVAERVLGRLTGAAGTTDALAAPAVVAARDLTPSEVRALDPAMVLGLCLERGSASAHSVILARAMGIPAVVGLGLGLSALPDGVILALDGERGLVWADPAPDEVRALESRREAWLAARREALAVRHAPARTRDGRAIRVVANISGVHEAAEALEYGAEGIGVLRTEFLFLGSQSAPSEDEQAGAYAAIAAIMRGRPLVVRTLDVGGDKALPYIEIGPEANPFLGWRGIRLTLGRRDLLRTQLRAVLRAAAGCAVEVLFPMVSSPAELLEAKAVLAEAESELAREGVPYQRVKAGVMIEVPAAAAVADQLARHADFFSIGANDLVQYAMAADRTNARVAAIADPFQPAVLRMIRQAVKAGREAGIGVTLCGELAADTLATALLIGMGLEEFSVSPALIPDLKRAIARTSASEAEAFARRALELESAPAVRSACAGELA